MICLTRSSFIQLDCVEGGEGERTHEVSGMSLTTDTGVLVAGTGSVGTLSLGGLDNLKSRTTSDIMGVKD